MVKVSDCSHMEIKKIYNWDVIKEGRKAVCCLTVENNDINNRFPKTVHISLSNIFALMDILQINALRELLGKEVKCMVYDSKITFLSTMRCVHEKDSDNNYVFCKEVEGV